MSLTDNVVQQISCSNYVTIYNYDLHEKLISIIIKLRKGYFPEGK